MPQATHGHTRGRKRSPEYRTWRNMLKRCHNQNSTDYGRYGGRGISVCDRWHNFEAFLADMGLKPSPKHEIDRISNDGLYEPDNCRWATRKEQHNNKRNNRLLTIGGRILTITAWAREANISPITLTSRVKSGWHQDWILMPFPGMVFWEG
jgi:hypothetical protein